MNLRFLGRNGKTEERKRAAGCGLITGKDYYCDGVDIRDQTSSVMVEGIWHNAVMFSPDVVEIFREGLKAKELL